MNSRRSLFAGLLAICGASVSSILALSSPKSVDIGPPLTPDEIDGCRVMLQDWADQFGVKITRFKEWYYMGAWRYTAFGYDGDHVAKKGEPRHYTIVMPDYARMS
jgi:hypothetical protein